MFTLDYDANLRKRMSQRLGYPRRDFCECVSRRYPAPKPLISTLNCAFAWAATLNIPLSLLFMTF